MFEDEGLVEEIVFEIGRMVEFEVLDKLVAFGSGIVFCLLFLCVLVVELVDFEL